METQTRYNLNAAIETWRAELAVQPNLTAEARRELETHLRDAITGFQQRGLNDEESFWLACKRVGQPKQLGEEFVKANPEAVWRERVFWMVSFVFLLNTVGVFTYYFPHFGLSNATMVYSQLNLIVLIAVGLLIMGTLRCRISKLTWLIGGHGRMTFVALTLILIAASFHYHNEVLNRAWQAKLGMPADPYPLWKFTALTSFYPVLLAVLMLWLMPTQIRKTPKHV